MFYSFTSTTESGPKMPAARSEIRTFDIGHEVVHIWPAPDDLHAIAIARSAPMSQVFIALY
jgi:hypothetical protein